MKKVAFVTLGCKLNFAETSTLARKFEENGYQKVEDANKVDVVVINTCSVTHLADKKCRNAIHRASKSNPNAVIAVVGCYSQLKPEEIAAIEGVDLVLGTKDKFNIVQYIEDLKNNREVSKIHSCEIEEVSQFESSFSLFDRTRSFLKIQDGCDYHCTYCTIPLARGESRNPTIGEAVKQAQMIASSGIHEIVLTGVNIGDFGKSTHETFIDLIRELDRVEGIERYRISSIEPNLLTDEIIQFVATSKRFMPHFHIPLQSGCNEVLALMSRRYKREVFENRVLKIKELLPDAFIGVDVIVGFPGETTDHFEDTISFLQRLPVTALHVFAYSERRNTKAILLPGKVDFSEKERRSQQLITLSESKLNEFYKQNLGRKLPILFESQNAKGKMFGFTNNYIKVEINFAPALVNKIVEAELISVAHSGNVVVEI